MRLLVLGATGMLGHAVLRYFHDQGDAVTGTVRDPAAARLLPEALRPLLVVGVHAEQDDTQLAQLFDQARPDVVVNCIGVVKQLASADDPLVAIPLNALLPHRLARIAAPRGCRLVQVSTDCVFAGTRGLYTEADTPDARDLYGLSKLLGEVDYPHAITLRTSIIGRELQGSRSLVDWFLAQQGAVRGYRKAIYSGLPTVEFARVLREFVLPRPELHGLYHMGSAPISKYDLLRLVAQAYGKSIAIEADDQVAIDRSLDSSRFQRATGYRPPDWPQLVQAMRAFD